MNSKAIHEKNWKKARYLRLALGHCHPTEEKIIQSILGTATENEEDARFIASMIQNEELKEFTIWGISFIGSFKRLQSTEDPAKLLADLRRSLSHFLLMFLQSEVLTGYGYVLPRNIDDSPVPIPEDVWFGSIDWENSRVAGGGLSFASVRIVSETETEEQSFFDVVGRAEASPGRPSKKHLMEKALEYGCEQGEIDVNESNIKVYQKVRDMIKHLFPDEFEDGKGLQNGAMQKHLAALIDSKRMK